MENYYFTFGQSHRTKEGTPLKDYWVKVTAENYTNARLIFMVMFCLVYIGEIDKFSFQYGEGAFGPEQKAHFKGGELVHYRQDVIQQQFYTLSI